MLAKLYEKSYDLRANLDVQHTRTQTLLGMILDMSMALLSDRQRLSEPQTRMKYA